MLLTHRQKSSNKSDSICKRKDSFWKERTFWSALCFFSERTFDNMFFSMSNIRTHLSKVGSHTHVCTLWDRGNFLSYSPSLSELLAIGQRKPFYQQSVYFHLICTSHIYVLLRTEETFDEGTDCLIWSKCNTCRVRLTNVIYRCKNKVGIQLLNLVPYACRRL